MSGPGISSALAACILACALLLQAALFPVPALADRGDSGHAAASGGADRTGYSFFPAEQPVFKMDPPGAGLLAMGGQSRERGAPPAGNGPAGTGETSAGSASRPALEGSFLGALLFGYPFEDFDFLDLVLLILLGFLLVWRFMPAPRSKKKPEEGSATGRRDTFSARPPTRLGHERPGDAGGKDSGPLAGHWPGDKPGSEPDSRKNGRPGREAENIPAGPERFPFRPRSGASGGQAGAGVRRYTGAAAPLPGAADTPGISPDESFDPDDFLEGARLLYIRMQEAWAERDTKSLAPFMTPDMMSLLRERAAADPHPVSMHIMLLDAALAGVERQNGEERAGVEFSVLMSTDHNTPVRIHEIWHFVREKSAGGTWRLAGIEEREEQR